MKNKNYKYQNTLIQRIFKDLKKLYKLIFFNKNRRKQRILEKRINRNNSLLHSNPRNIFYKLSCTSSVVLLAQSINAQVNFATPNTNPFSLSQVTGFTTEFVKPSFVDIDGDGDLDLFIGSGDGNFSYYENIGTASSPSFSAPQLNPFSLTQLVNGYSCPTFADLDNDGDFDMITGTDDYYPAAFIYFENIGSNTNPSFSSQQVNPFGSNAPLGYLTPEFVDIDDDGDFDILSGGLYGDFYFTENTGTSSSPQLANPVTNSFSLSSVNFHSTPTFADLDNDGDLDMLTYGYSNGSNSYSDLVYFENTGSSNAPNFNTPVLNPFSLNVPSSAYWPKPSFADLDSDGDMDVLCLDYYGNFYYFENESIASIKDGEEMKEFSVYPNPSNGIVNVKKLNNSLNLTSFDVINTVGQVVTSKKIESTLESIDLSGLSEGTYYMNLIYDGGFKSVVIVIE